MASKRSGFGVFKAWRPMRWRYEVPQRQHLSGRGLQTWSRALCRHER